MTKEVFSNLALRFKSGNKIDVPSIIFTRELWLEVDTAFRQLSLERDGLVEEITALKHDLERAINNHNADLNGGAAECPHCGPNGPLGNL